MKHRGHRFGMAVLTASLVGVGLLAICVGWLPDRATAAAGWILLTSGILVGGVQGLWFWFRLLPVPRVLDAPFGPGRWALIGVHVALVAAGFAMAASALATR